MPTEIRKRTTDLPAGATVGGTDLVPIYQTALGLTKITATALATFLVPLVIAAQPWVNLPTAATVALAGTSSPNVLWTGAVTVSSAGTGTDGTRRFCRAAASFKFTNGANLVCPGGIDLTMRAGDRWTMVLVGTSQWFIENVQRADGSPISFIGGPNGMRNRVVNGAMGVDQENGGASSTITAAAALKWVADVHYAWCTGANVTAAVVTNAAGQYRLRYTGAASNTLVGFGHRIERENVRDMAGQSAVLSVSLASSSLTTIAWEVYRANSNDTFGTLASPTRTLLASGTFTPVSAAETRFSTPPIAVPAAATTGVEIVLKSTAGLLAAATLDIGDVQFEGGSFANDFERRPTQVELLNVQRYFQKLTCWIPQTTGVPAYWATKRVTPSVSSPASGFTTSGGTVTVDGCFILQTTGGVSTLNADARLST